MKLEFPKEYMVELKGLSPHYVGRITVYAQSEKYNIEIDIIHSESGKIFNHVKSIFGENNERDAVDISVHHLKQYLDSKKH